MPFLTGKRTFPRFNNLLKTIFREIKKKKLLDKKHTASGYLSTIKNAFLFLCDSSRPFFNGDNIILFTLKNTLLFAFDTLPGFDQNGDGAIDASINNLGDITVCPFCSEENALLLFKKQLLDWKVRFCHFRIPVVVKTSWKHFLCDPQNFPLYSKSPFNCWKYFV